MVTPLPPAPSGVADYVSNILPSLQKNLDISLITNQQQLDDQKEAGVFWIHQLANNIQHSLAYQTAKKYPGLVVLHDLTLSYMMYCLSMEQGRNEILYREVEEVYGEAQSSSLRSKLEDGKLENLWSLRFIEGVLEKAKAVLVHNYFAEATLRQLGYRGPIFIAPMPYDPMIVQQPLSQREARRVLGLPSDSFIIGVFGFLGPYKRMEVAIPAFRELLHVVPDARLLVAGHIQDHYAEEFRMLMEPVKDSITLTGRLKNEDWYLSLLSADVCINLRFPTIAESSAVLSTVLASGLPCLVSDLGSYAEIPPGIVAPIPRGRWELRETGFLLVRLALDDRFRISMGYHAKKYALKSMSPEACVQCYMDAIKQVVKV